MPRKQRCPHEILTSIVEACKQPINKTNLYFKLETSFDVFNHYHEQTLRHQLIEQHGDKYQITAKGTKFLEAWSKFQELLKSSVVTPHQPFS